MNATYLIVERRNLTERVKFIDAILESIKPAPKPEPPYGCQQYGERLCRFDRRAQDRKCNGCTRVTDSVELKRMGLWVEGISHV